MSKSAARQFLVTVSGVEGFWATCVGGQKTSDATKVWDGGSAEPEVLTAPAAYAAVTVGRPYDPVRDGAVCARLRPQVGSLVATITRQPTDRSLVRTGSPTYYTGVLTGVTEPDTDASSSDPARVELVFAITS